MFKSKEFKLIVAGGRDFNDYALLSRELNLLANEDYHDREVSIVSGMAPGADSHAVRFARDNNVQLYKMPAKWQRPDGSTNKGAGFARNQDMGNFADGLLAFWDGKSRGTAHMIEYMRKLNKPTHVINY